MNKILLLTVLLLQTVAAHAAKTSACILLSRDGNEIARCVDRANCQFNFKSYTIDTKISSLRERKSDINISVSKGGTFLMSTSSDHWVPGDNVDYTDKAVAAVTVRDFKVRCVLWVEGY